MIKIEQDGALTRLTLNRPDKANALMPEMLEQLSEAVEAAQDSAKVLVLTGAGKVFCAGADLEAAKAGLATSPLWERLSSAIARFDGLSIAALNGTVAGGAMGMVLACDMRIATEGAKAFYPVMKLGYLPQPSDPARLTALVGPARARMMLMGGAKFSTEEAYTFGLFDRIVPRETLEETVAELAADSLAAAPTHVAGIKHLCRGD